MATYGAFHWNELMTTGPEAAAELFRGLIGHEPAQGG